MARMLAEAAAERTARRRQRPTQWPRDWIKVDLTLGLISTSRLTNALVMILSSRLMCLGVFYCFNDCFHVQQLV